MKNKKGFTLAELLIVVAIIAVLVAISIPIFSSQIEKSKEATDAANIRSKYAEMLTEVISGNYDYETNKNDYIVNLIQGKDNWQTTFDFPFEEVGTPKANGKATLYFKDNKAYVSYDGTSGGGDTSSTIDNIKKNSTTINYNKTEKYSLTANTLYKYKDNYYIAKSDKEDVNKEPGDNVADLFLVDFSKIYKMNNSDDYDSLKDIDAKRGMVIHIKDSDNYYVIVDTNSNINASTKMIGLN